MKELLKFENPVSGTLVKRYKRFLADILLSDGRTVTSHCTNTGSMKNVCVPNQPVILSESPNKNRKLAYTWEAIHTPELKGSQFVGVNTSNPNKLIFTALEQGLIPEVGETQNRDRYVIQKEVVVAPGTRLDFKVEDLKTGETIYIEVKNVTLSDGTTALFPDSVSERATKHLLTLQKLKTDKTRSIVFFVTQRPDCTAVAAAGSIDKVYAKTLTEVLNNGVEALAYSFHVSSTGISLGKKLNVLF